MSISLADIVEIKDFFDLTEVHEYSFAEEVPIGDGFGYAKLKAKGEVDEKLKKGLDQLSREKALDQMAAPFIGLYPVTA